MDDEEYLQFLDQEGADLGEFNPYGFFPQDFRYPRNTLTQDIPIATAQNPAMVNYGIMGTDQANNFEFLSSAFEDEGDDEQVEYLGSKPSGIAKLAEFLMPGNFLYNTLGSILPKQSPQSIAMKNFYGSQFGLTPTGSVASGIMQGYNPVSGGFLNMITGGKYGKPTQYGLAGAMQRRIENILGRKAAQTAASAAKVAELKKLQLDEMKMREKGGESLSSIGKSTFSGPGMAFAPKKDTFSGGKTKTTGGVPGGKYGSPK